MKKKREPEKLTEKNFKIKKIQSEMKTIFFVVLILDLHCKGYYESDEVVEIIWENAVVSDEEGGRNHG